MVLSAAAALFLAVPAFPASPSAPGEGLPEIAARIDQLRGTADPDEEELLLEEIDLLQAELRRRQGEIDPWIRYWHGLRRRVTAPIFFLGLVGQMLFASRFLIQWLASYRRGESYVPVAFWYVSSIGSVLVLSYGIITKEPIIILGQFGLFVYVYNLVLIRRKRLRTEDAGVGSDSSA